MDEKLNGKTVVLTTSNCTRAILEARSEGAKQILLGSFVNISALCNYLKKQKKNVLLLCAGWKNRYNLEDSLVAGAMAEMLHEDFSVECDSALASMHLYQQAKDNLSTYLQNSSHTRRLHHLHIDKDIQFCLKRDQFTAIPFFDGHSVKPLA